MLCSVPTCTPLVHVLVSLWMGRCCLVMITTQPIIHACQMMPAMDDDNKMISEDTAAVLPCMFHVLCELAWPVMTDICYSRVFR